MKLAEIIDLSALQQIQDCFSKSTGFAAITVDYQGKPLLRYSCFSKFCSKLRADSRYNDCCRQSDAHGSLEAVRRGEVYIYRCHAGLIDFAVPIIVEGAYIASMLCGQVRTDDPLPSGPLNQDSDILSHRPDLLAEYEAIPLVSLQRIRDTANLMYLTLNYIVEQYLLNKKNISLLREQKEKAEIERQYKDLEVRYYHSQINPHFLFNALNAAGRQAYMENAAKTQDIIFALADMYRYYLDYSGLLITVEQELMNVKNYLFIQKIRFGEQLQHSIRVPEEMWQYMVPAMSLQIFVENAVRHGLEPQEALGSITVSGELEGDRLAFEVIDNGVGITESNLRLLNDPAFTRTPLPGNMGMGIYNIRKRLEHFFPAESHIRFEKADLRGTRVVLQIPVTGRAPEHMG